MLTWKTEEGGVITAGLPITDDVRLVLRVYQDGSPLLWHATASFEDDGFDNVTVYKAGGLPPGVQGHFADATAAKADCVRSAKLVLLNLINEMR